MVPSNVLVCRVVEITLLVIFVILAILAAIRVSGPADVGDTPSSHSEARLNHVAAPEETENASSRLCSLRFLLVLSAGFPLDTLGVVLPTKSFVSLTMLLNRAPRFPVFDSAKEGIVTENYSAFW
jgi:hypothetical protein